MALNILNVALENQESKCMICLENLTNEPQYSLPECNHTFHQNCIMHWFRSGSHKCPLCNNLGINDTTNNEPSMDRWSWWHRGKEKYKRIRQYARKKDAPQILKKEVNKLKKLEAKQKALRKEIKNFKNKIGTFKELDKEWNNYKNKRWRIEGNIRKLKMSIANFNVVPIIIAKKVVVEN